MSIRIGIFGYGNLGRGIECAVRQNPDMEIAAVFTRRDPEKISILTEGVPVYSSEDAAAHTDEIDVMNTLRRKCYRSSGADTCIGFAL